MKSCRIRNNLWLQHLTNFSYRLFGLRRKANVQISKFKILFVVARFFPACFFSATGPVQLRQKIQCFPDAASARPRTHPNTSRLLSPAYSLTPGFSPVPKHSSSIERTASAVSPDTNLCRSHRASQRSQSSTNRLLQPNHPLTPGFSPVTKAPTADRKNRFSGFLN